ncbi:signal-regulatory protein beta-1-like [Sorex fumeus]|uniref:signal-regulatory protein beta-1-like n=1 Tax=Sorex fumeus TaxID=62283 RepID=UPI0024AD803A|nr:signal-regulatory protein beta-1-like [Sorex fumeus]
MSVLIFWLYLLPLHLQLTPLLGLTGVAGKDVKLQVIQPDKFMSVAVGETVILRCSLTSLLPVGPVKWVREILGVREDIYSFASKVHSSRVTNVSDTTKRDNMDFSIRICDISPADTGTYYCVKFQKGNVESVEFKSGPGTWVTVSAKPSHPEIFGPTKRVPRGHTVSFTCKSDGFFPRNISLQWFKNRNTLLASHTIVELQRENTSYSISSTARVPLTSRDVHSQVICEVNHVFLRGGPPLRAMVNLSEIIQVPPTLEVSQFPAVGNQVNLTCQVKKFYPQNLQLTWLENGNVSRAETASLLLENKDGTFNRTSWLLLNYSARQKNVAFTCQVKHDRQPALTKSHILGSNEQPGKVTKLLI